MKLSECPSAEAFQTAHQLLSDSAHFLFRKALDAQLVSGDEELDDLLDRAAIAADEKLVDEAPQLIEDLSHVTGNVARVDRSADWRHSVVRGRLPVEDVQYRHVLFERLTAQPVLEQLARQVGRS
jgi:hypothetical protein